MCSFIFKKGIYDSLKYRLHTTRARDRYAFQCLVQPCSAMHLLRIESHQVVDCCLWIGGSPLFNGCVLLDIGRMEHAVIHVSPEHPKHGQWVTYLVSTQAMQRLYLCTDPCNVWVPYHAAVSGWMVLQWASVSCHGAHTIIPLPPCGCPFTAVI